MLGNRLQNFLIWIRGLDFINGGEGLITIGDAGDKRGPRSRVSSARFPIEWIAPTIVRVAFTACLDENLKKVLGARQILGLQGSLVKIGEAHRVVRVGQGKPSFVPEQRAKARSKGFHQN